MFKKMSKYGHAFDETFDPSKTKIYNLITSIYNDPELTKTRDDEKSSTYMAKTSCLLINECRYLIATVPKDQNIIGNKYKLSTLFWTNFQTRTLRGKFNCCSCSSANRLHKSTSLELSERNEQYTQYKANEYNVTVSLLHTKKNNLYEYPDRGDIIAALELYQTVISF